MVVLALFTALALDQFRPLHAQHRLYDLLRAAATHLRRLLDANNSTQAHTIWTLAVIVPAVASWLIFKLLYGLNGVLGFAWMVLVLYATIDFRAFGLHFTEVRNAFSTGDVPRAQQALQRWRADHGQDEDHDHDEDEDEDGARPHADPLTRMQAQTVHLSILHMHRCVFGVFTAFLLLAFLDFGPMGAVLFRLGSYAYQNWCESPDERAGHTPASAALARTADAAWQAINWLPARVSMLMFAAVGRFDEAVTTWRTWLAQQASSDALVIATGTAALGQDPEQLQQDLFASSAYPDDENFQEEGSERAAAVLHRLAGMIWRALVLWVMLMLVIGLIDAAI